MFDYSNPKFYDKCHLILLCGSNDLACIVGMPTFVPLVEEASLLRVLGMRSAALIPLAVSAALVDG